MASYRTVSYIMICPVQMNSPTALFTEVYSILTWTLSHLKREMLRKERRIELPDTGAFEV